MTIKATLIRKPQAVMGNCGRKGLSETNRHRDSYGDVDTQSTKEVPHDEVQKEDNVMANDVVTKEDDDDMNEEVPAVEEIEEYEDYYHVDNSLENYTEWDIIEFECVTPLLDDDKAEVFAADDVTLLSNAHKEDTTVFPVMEHSSDIELGSPESPTLLPRSRRSNSKVRFSESEGSEVHPLYTLYEDKESTSDNNVDYLDDPRLYSSSSFKDRSDTRSLQSYMSDVSTASMIANFDPILANRVSSARIQIHLNYDVKSWLLRVGVKQIECFLDQMFQDLRVYWQVHMTLLPFKRQRLKTKYKRSSNPLFNQAFEVRMIERSVLNQISVRYRLYGRFGRAGRKRLAGEMIVELASLIKKPNNFLLEWRAFTTMIDENSRRASLDSL